MALIKLTQNQFAIVDDADLQLTINHRWYAFYNKPTRSYYAASHIRDGNKIKTLFLHRFLLNVSERKIYVDHINHNTLDNGRHNLRTATASESVANRKSFQNSTSKYLGVCWLRKRKKWQASISKNYKVTFLGRFDIEEDAARAYDKAAIQWHGEFANLNFKTA